MAVLSVNYIGKIQPPASTPKIQLKYVAKGTHAP